MGSIVFAQAMRPPQMSFTVIASTSDPLIFSITCTAFWDSLPSLQITYTGQSRQMFADLSIIKFISFTKQIMSYQAERFYRTKKNYGITKFSRLVDKEKQTECPDYGLNNLLRINFTTADQLHRLTVVVLEQGSPSNSSSQKQVNTLFCEYA